MTPQPIETADRKQRILGLVEFNGDKRAWYVFAWDHDTHRVNCRPFWRAEGLEHMGRNWLRNNQPKVWLPLPEVQP